MKHTKINIGLMAFVIFALFAAFCTPASASQAELYSLDGEECIFDGTFVLDGEYYDVYKYVDLRGVESISVFSHGSLDLIDDKDIFLKIANACIVKDNYVEWRYYYECSKYNFLVETDFNNDEIKFFDDLNDINCRDVVAVLRSTNELLEAEIQDFEKIIRICNYIEDGGNDAIKINEIETLNLIIENAEKNRSLVYKDQAVAYEKAYDSIEDDYYYKDDVDTWRKETSNSIEVVMRDIDYLSYSNTVRLEDNAEYVSKAYDLSMYRQSEYERLIELENNKNESGDATPESAPFVGIIGASLILCAASKFR